jgi:hypothetical protein
MTELFVLRFTSVVCPREGETFPVLQDAIDRGIDAGFEFTVQAGGEIVASWTVFGGLRLRS